MPQNDRVFADGVFASRNDNAPDYVIGRVDITKEGLEWIRNNMEDHGKGARCSIDILRSKKGNLYAQKNTYVPKSDDSMEFNG